MKNYSIIYFDAAGNVLMTCQLQGADVTHNTIDAGTAAQWPANASAAVAIFGTDLTTDAFSYAEKP
jgi:hypothetical protein